MVQRKDSYEHKTPILECHVLASICFEEFAKMTEILYFTFKQYMKILFLITPFQLKKKKKIEKITKSNVWFTKPTFTSKNFYALNI